MRPLYGLFSAIIRPLYIRYVFTKGLYKAISRPIHGCYMAFIRLLYGHYGPNGLYTSLIRLLYGLYLAIIRPSYDKELISGKIFLPTSTSIRPIYGRIMAAYRPQLFSQFLINIDK